MTTEQANEMLQILKNIDGHLWIMWLMLCWLVGSGVVDTFRRR